MNSREKILEQHHLSIVEAIEEYNKALRAGDFSKMSSAEETIKKEEKYYAEVKTEEVFEKIKGTENPIKSGIEKYSFLILSHKNVREDGKVVALELSEKSKQIDLAKLAKHCGLKYDFKYMIEKFNQLLCMRAAKELKLSDVEIKKICDSFYMDKLSKAINLGETPTSNTQICKQLQAIIDEIIFEDDGKGKNIHKANNHDVAYLLNVYTKKGRRMLSVATARNADMQKFIADICHRIVCDKVYGLEFKMEDTTSPESKSGEGSTKKATAEEIAEVDKKVESKAKRTSVKKDQKVTEIEKDKAEK